MPTMLGYPKWVHLFSWRAARFEAKAGDSQAGIWVGPGCIQARHGIIGNVPLFQTGPYVSVIATT